MDICKNLNLRDIHVKILNGILMHIKNIQVELISLFKWYINICIYIYKKKYVYICTCRYKLLKEGYIYVKISID